MNNDSLLAYRDHLQIGDHLGKVDLVVEMDDLQVATYDLAGMDDLYLEENLYPYPDHLGMTVRQAVQVESLFDQMVQGGHQNVKEILHLFHVQHQNLHQIFPHLAPFLPYWTPK